MKEAPFNITIVLLAMLAAMLVLGGIFGAIFGASGLSGYWIAFLSAVLTVPFMGRVRNMVGGAAARHEGIMAQAPFAFSMRIRLIAGAIVAAIVAYFFRSYSAGFLIGAGAAAITNVILFVIYYIALSMRKS